jgi:hypothetical protein
MKKKKKENSHHKNGLAGVGRVTQVAEQLSSKCEALSSSPVPPKIIKKNLVLKCYFMFLPVFFFSLVLLNF